MNRIWPLMGFLTASLLLFFSCSKNKSNEPDVRVPTVTTVIVTGITQSTAACGGNITSDGGAAVTARGVCWSTNPTPTIADSNKTSDGAWVGSFTSSITNLTGNTPYYVRAYATNSAGTGYGNAISFTTTPVLPILTTAAVSAITQTTAECGGTITSDGGDTVTARGVCWSRNPTPTLGYNKTTDGAGTGSFTSSITNLIGNTLHYVRAYATNSAGTGYGNAVSFTTSPILPVLTTAAVSAKTQTTAECGGTITSDGGDTVTARGVCWSTNPTPTLADNKTTDGAGTGSFTSSITGLTADAPYYVRAYATNSVGTGYGSAISFTTLPVPQVPALTTASVSAKTDTTAQCGGIITSDGGAAVTARGVCWSTNPTPTIADSNKTTDGAGTGSFTSSITGLTANTLYYVRAYATNSVGTGYGSAMSFTTLPPPVTDFDGNVYQTVTIGTQVWMAENLKVTHYRNGYPIPNVTDAETWAGLLNSGAYCNYDNDEANVAVYGRLYNWWAVRGVRDSWNLAPAGWHVPTDADWKQLEMYLGMTWADADQQEKWRGTDQGSKLKESGTTHWASSNTGATNESGFSALPGGWRRWGEYYQNMRELATFWSSSTDDGYSAWSRSLRSDLSTVYRVYEFGQVGLSIRCVKD